MPPNHFLNTPEALLGRNDSKNPTTTCRGITSTGRPCRRALALNKNGTIDSSNIGGVVALLKQDAHIADAQYYCWQHKDQTVATAVTHHAPSKSSRPSQKQTEILDLKNRSSIDTLVQRLGIESTDHAEPRKTHDSRRPSTRPGKHSSRPSRPPEKTFWSSLCCMSVVDDSETLEVVRRRKRLDESSMQTATMPIRTSQAHPRPSNTPATGQSFTAGQTHGSLFELVPPDTSPQIASALLAELSKPLSQYDEAGYIYIFWLTPSNKQDPGETTAKALLAPETGRTRRVSDVMTEFSYSADHDQPASKTPKTILLKIGRANNVTRRMNEWQRQCGHRLNLVRWYPYAPTLPSPQPSPAKTSQPLYPDLSQYDRPAASRRTSSNVRKVSNVKRVERLVHLELADQQAKQLCEACGREHREWFKVEASESGIRKVDSIVRRWVDWAERL